MDEGLESEPVQAPSEFVPSGFDGLFPLPFRVSLLLLLGVWGWAVNVLALNNVYVDMDQVLRYQTGRPLAKSLFSMASIMSVIFMALCSLFWVSTAGRLDLGVHGFEIEEILAWASFFMIVGILVFPIARRFHGNGRQRFQGVLRRILLGGINGEHRLPDILVSDALTSYAKVFADIAVMMCNLSHGRSSLVEPDRKCGIPSIIPLISGVPFAIRMVQCYTDYTRTGDKTHMANLCKYLTSFPVLLSGYFQGDVTIMGIQAGSQAMFRVWVLTVLVNSTYSFVWDVTFDWDLELFRYAGKYRHGGLRHILYFPSRPLYWTIIFTNYILRFTWSLRLSTSWYHFPDRELGLFVLELAEVFRRWMWIFLRVEAEWVRNIKDVPSFPLSERND